MAMSQELVLKLVGDADSATRALHQAAAAADVTVSAYRKAEREQEKQNRTAQAAAAAQAKAAAEQKRINEELAASQAAASTAVGKGMLVAGAAMAAGLGLSIKAAIDWESAWAGVKKVVNGTPEQMAVLEKQLRSLTSVLPATHGEIAAVAAAAGQLGIQRGNIAGFTKTMIELGVSTNISAEQGAMSLAKFMNIMGTSQGQISNLGSTLVYLGNNFATTEDDILQMTMRLAGAGKTAGLTEADVMGIATALSSVGIEAEAGGSAFSKVITNIAQAVSSGGEDLDKFAKTAGMSADQFAAQWSKNPAQAIAAFVSGLGRIQKAGGDVFGTLDQLGITELRMRDALLRSAGAGDQMAQAITGANGAFKENTALQNEAAQRFATTASQIQLLGNGFVEAGINIGSTFLPVIAFAVDVVKAIVDGFNALPGPVQAGISVMLGLGTAVLLAGGAALVLGPRIAALNGQFVTLAASSGLASSAIGKAGLAMLGPWGAALAAVTGGIALATGLFNSGAPAVEDYAGYVEQLTQAFQESSGAIDENITKTAAMKVAQSDLGRISKDAGINLGSVTDAVLGNGDAYDKVLKQLKDYRKESEGMTFIDDRAKDSALSSIDSAISGLEKLRGATTEAKSQAELFAEAQAGAGEGALGAGKDAKTAAGGMDTLAASQGDIASSADVAKAAIDGLKTAFDTLNGIQQDSMSATADFTLALAGMADAVKDNGTGFDLSTEKGAKNAKMLQGLVDNGEKVVLAKYQEALATGDAAAAQDAANSAYASARDEILKYAAANGLSADEVSALLDQIFQMPDLATTEVKVTGAQAATEALETLGAKAYETANGTYQVKVDALTDDARLKLESLGFQVVEMPNGEFMVTALTADAQTALSNVLSAAGVVDAQAPTVPVTTPGAAQSKTDLDKVTAAAVGADAQNPTLPTTAPGAVTAMSQLQGVTGAASTIPPMKQTQVNAETGVAYGRLTGIQEALSGIKDKSVTVTTYFQSIASGATPAFTPSKADGGYVKAANGRSAMYAPGGSNILWAEPETNGEWYIPQAESKRARSKGLASDMLNSWGYAMVPQGALQQTQSAPIVNVNIGGGSVSGELTMNEGMFAGIIRAVVRSELNDSSRRANSLVSR